MSKTKSVWSTGKKRGYVIALLMPGVKKKEKLRVMLLRQDQRQVVEFSLVMMNTGTIFKSHRTAAGVLARYAYKHVIYHAFILPVGERENDRVRKAVKS